MVQLESLEYLFFLRTIIYEHDKKTWVLLTLSLRENGPEGGFLSRFGTSGRLERPTRPTRPTREASHVARCWSHSTLEEVW